MLHLSEICLKSFTITDLFDQADFIARNITASSQSLKQTIKIYITELTKSKFIFSGL